MKLLHLLHDPWPWYVAGPLLGLTPALLLLLGNKSFGISSNLRHLCAMLPRPIDFFRYDWRAQGSWNLSFALGLVLGGFVGLVLLGNPHPVALSPAALRTLHALGVAQEAAPLPTALFSWAGLFTLRGALLMVAGGFLVGFGARYAGGCTSGHGITGMARLQRPSLIAVLGFFGGGIFSADVLLPLIMRLGGGA